MASISRSMKFFRYLYTRFISSLWHRVKLEFQNFDKTQPILIYQMGKVGSSSVYESLKHANLENPVYHVHFLSYSHLDQVEKYHRSVNATSSIGVLRFWRALRRKIDRSKRPVYLISLVRDPVAREISDVFQNVESHHASLLDDKGDVDIDETMTFLNQRFSDFDESTDYACTWFDREVLDTFGLDVYATPFDHERGYVILENSKVSLLLLRVEDLSRIFEVAMREFIGKSIHLQHANIADNKRYSQAYRRLLKMFSLSMSCASKIYASRYSRHFYPDEIRHELMQKWLSDNPVEINR